MDLKGHTALPVIVNYPTFLWVLPRMPSQSVFDISVVSTDFNNSSCLIKKPSDLLLLCKACFPSHFYHRNYRRFSGACLLRQKSAGESDMALDQTVQQTSHPASQNTIWRLLLHTEQERLKSTRITGCDLTSHHKRLFLQHKSLIFRQCSRAKPSRETSTVSATAVKQKRA